MRGGFQGRTFWVETYRRIVDSYRTDGRKPDKLEGAVLGGTTLGLERGIVCAWMQCTLEGIVTDNTTERTRIESIGCRAAHCNEGWK